jgi:phosphoribosylaminoimidazolecarboxamide formyltransferase/IMP cyclohydrolase
MVAGPQADVVIAPGYEDGTIVALRKKRKNTRVLQAPPPSVDGLDLRQISGGFLVQTPHEFLAARDDWRVVTKRAPTEEEWRDAELAWRVCGYVKSNAIVLVKDGQAVGIGAGQQNRVQSGEIAAGKAAGRAAGGACASDAFYPFPDGVEAAAAAGVAVVVQPGGSVGDEKVIDKADELGLAMVFTGERHFLH